MALGYLISKLKINGYYANLRTTEITTTTLTRPRLL
jgi:hypothetical protein